MSSISYDPQVFQRISAFVLNRTTNDLRSELHEYLVMMALSEDEKGQGTTTLEILTSIEKDLKIEKIPVSLVNSAISGLSKQGFIETIHGRGGNRYLLSHDKRNKIRLMREQYSQSVARVRKKLAEKIREKVIGTPIDMTLEITAFITFQNFLGTVLSNLGAECCYAIVGSRGKELPSLKPLNIPELLNDILTTVKDKDLRKAERLAFIEYISDPDDDLSDYLFSLAQSYFIIHILHLDPECQSCTRESLRKKKVYVDTNVIVHSLAGKERGNEAVNRALNLTKELGIGIVFSKRTKQEFSNLVGDKKRIFGKNPKVPKNRYEKLRSTLRDGLLKDFLDKKSKNPNLTFERYADRLEEIEAVLGNRYSVTYDDNEYNEISEHPDMPVLKTIVVNEGERFSLYKNSTVAEHDAFHILLIQELRKKEASDILGPNFWFLTRDRSLSHVEERFGKYEKFPSSIFVDNWIQMISPLLAPEQTKSARDAYTSLFASRLPILTKAIGEDVFLAYQGKWMDDEDLKPEDVARVIGNRYIMDYYKKAVHEDKQITEEELEMITQPIIEEVKKQAKEGATLRRGVASLKRKTTQLQIETKELKRTVGNQRNIITWLGHLVGGIIFIGLWFILYAFVLIHSMEPLQAHFSSMIIAAIFGYLSDFHGYKWLVDKLLKYHLGKG